MAITVVIADDHAYIRTALQELFATTDDIRVVGVCVDGSEVVPTVTSTAPDIVLMDLNMPKMSGLQATGELRDTHPQVRVVILSGDVAPGAAKTALALGVAGFLLKEDDPGDLPERIRAVAGGGTAWSDAAAAKLAA